MTVVWIIVTLALAFGACFVGWCIGYDAGVEDTTRKWMTMWPKLAKTSYDMAAAYGQTSIDEAVRAIVSSMEVPGRARR
jgi:hypothetical protein